MKRQRGRNNNRRNNNNNNNNMPNLNRSYDSNGPDVKIRGNANTIYEKYVTMARDAKTSGNRVKAESYLQHAEHYLRLHQEIQAKVNALKAEKEAARLAREEQRAAEREANKDRSSEAKSTESAEDESVSNEAGDRKPRRNQRSRRYREEQKGSSDTQNDNPTQDIPAEDSAEASAPKAVDEDSDVRGDAKPARRKRAPSRKAEASKQAETETAAE